MACAFQLRLVAIALFSEAEFARASSISNEPYPRFSIAIRAECVRQHAKDVLGRLTIGKQWSGVRRP